MKVKLGDGGAYEDYTGGDPDANVYKDEEEDYRYCREGQSPEVGDLLVVGVRLQSQLGQPGRLARRPSSVHGCN